MIDHTLLKPEATPIDVQRLCGEAVDLGVFAVCISPSMVRTAREALAGRGVAVATVAGFPSGAHSASIKATEAARSAEEGADEVDVVINLALVKTGRWDELEREVALVRNAIPTPTILKV